MYISDDGKDEGTEETNQQQHTERAINHEQNQICSTTRQKFMVYYVFEE